MNTSFNGNRHADPPLPLTLLITTFNRGGLLRQSLDRLCQLTLPEETIVVDDGGVDDTEAMCREFEDRLNLRYVYHDNPGPSICSMARNVGLRLASHEWIVTSEPELIFYSDVLADFRALHDAYPNDVISAGHVWFAPPGHHEPTLPPGAEEAVGWVAPYAALYAKEWIVEVGGWDEGFPGPWGWDDTDLLTRLRMAGHGQYRATEVEAIHQYHGLGADAGSQNEAYWLSKSFHADWTDLGDMVANKDREWGRLRERV